jgi:ABC-2 type transport system permease protein
LAGSAYPPIESMPILLQYAMRVISRTPHFVAFSQAGLYRDVDLSIVWPRLVAIATIGNVYFTFSLTHFRNVIFGIELASDGHTEMAASVRARDGL